MFNADKYLSVFVGFWPFSLPQGARVGDNAAAESPLVHILFPEKK